MLVTAKVEEYRQSGLSEHHLSEGLNELEKERQGNKGVRNAAGLLSNILTRKSEQQEAEQRKKEDSLLKEQTYKEKRKAEEQERDKCFEKNGRIDLTAMIAQVKAGTLSLTPDPIPQQQAVNA
jgi:hypothetical protein